MIEDYTSHIGMLTVVLFIPASQSLKDKRMVIKSIKDRVRNKFNVSIAELEEQDKWQLAVFGIVMIGNDNRHIDQTLQNILSLIEGYPEAQITEQRMEFL